MEIKNILIILTLLVSIACTVDQKVDEKSNPSDLGIHEYVHKRHIDLIEMEYLLQLENEHLLYFLNQKDYASPRLYKNWWNYYQTDKTIQLVNEFKVTNQKTESLMEEGLMKLDSIKLTNKVNRTVINAIELRLKSLEELHDSLSLRIEKEYD